MIFISCYIMSDEHSLISGHYLKFLITEPTFFQSLSCIVIDFLNVFSNPQEEGLS